MTTPPPAPRPNAPGRGLLVLGLCLPFLGITAYAVQFLWLQRLTAPWYIPCAATLGLVLVGVSLSRRRTTWRVLALVLVALLAGLEWTFLAKLRLEPYHGPVATGQPFPAFATRRADGTPFSQRDLQDGRNTVLVFFRGRW